MARPCGPLRRRRTQPLTCPWSLSSHLSPTAHRYRRSLPTGTRDPWASRSLAVVGRHTVDASPLRALRRGLADADVARSCLRTQGSGDQGWRGGRCRCGHRVRRHHCRSHRLCRRDTGPARRQRPLVPLGEPARPLGWLRHRCGGRFPHEWHRQPGCRLRAVLASNQGSVVGACRRRRRPHPAPCRADLSRPRRLWFRRSPCRHPDAWWG